MVGSFWAFPSLTVSLSLASPYTTLSPFLSPSAASCRLERAPQTQAGLGSATRHRLAHTIPSAPSMSNVHLMVCRRSNVCDQRSLYDTSDVIQSSLKASFITSPVHTPSWLSPAFLMPRCSAAPHPFPPFSFTFLIPSTKKQPTQRELTAWLCWLPSAASWRSALRQRRRAAP